MSDLGLPSLHRCSRLIVTYLVAIPIGIYSATHQYSLGDYFFTIFGFVGLAMPTFFLALVLMFYINRATGLSVGGLYSPEFMNQPMNLAKFVDMLKHISILVVAVGLAGTASIIRILRSGILDEFQKQYVIAARSKGMNEVQLLLKYPVRLALNPIVSTIGWIFPTIVSGSTVTAIVMNIPTIGAAFIRCALGTGYLCRSGVDHAAFGADRDRHVISDILLAVVSIHDSPTRNRSRTPCSCMAT